MGDIRFERPYERLRGAADRVRELYAMSDDDVVQALAAASGTQDPFLANVLATEALNRMRRSQTAMAHLGEGVIASDTEGRITSVNPAAERLLGYSREELIGRDIHETIHSTDKHGRPIPREECPVLGVLKTGKPVERDDDIYTRKDGSVFNVAYTAAPIMREGEVHGFVSAFRDISAWRRTQDQILFQKSLLEAQAESSADGQVLLDEERRILSYNTTFLEVWGFTREEVESLSYTQLLAKAASLTRDPQDYLERVERVYAEDMAIARDEVELRDGRVYQRIATRLRAPRGGTYGWLLTFRDITLEHQASQRLKRSEQRYRQLFHAVPFMTFTIGPDLRIRTVNDTAVRQLGYGREALEGRPVVDLYVKDERESAINTMRAIIDRGGTRRRDLRKLRADGTAIEVQETVTRTQDVDGRPVLIVLCEDISERKEREHALTDSRQRLSSLFSGSPDGIVTIDLSGALLEVNPASVALIGRKPEEVQGNIFTRYVDPEDVERVWELFGQALEGRAVRTELGLLHREGHTIPTRVTGIPVTVEGEVVGVHGILQDLRAELRAKDLPSKLAAAALDAIVIIDGDDRVLDWNPAATRLFGYTRDEAIGRALAELVVPERHREAHLKGVGRAASLPSKERFTRRYEMSALRKDGTEFDAELSITSLPGDEPRFAGFVRDLTQRRHHEAALMRFQRLVDAVHDYAIYMLDPEGRVTSWNSGARRIKGYGDEEVMGKHFRMFYPPQDQDERHPERNLERAAREGRVEEEGWRVRKDGSRFWARVTITPILDDAEGHLVGFAKVTRDLTRVHEAQQAVRTRAEQHDVVARLGLAALRREPLQNLFDDAVEQLQRVLAVDYTQVLQLDPDKKTMTLRAGVGWQPHIRPHHSQVSAGLESQAGYTLAASEPVIVQDLSAETRFNGPPLLVEHGVVSGMSVIVYGTRGPWGVLGIHSRTPRVFTQDDVNFLQSVANVLANAIQRADQDATLERRVEERTRRLVESNRDLQTFANAASHDLRAPIRGVDALLSATLEDHGEAMPEEARELIDRALRDNRRAGQLIRDILAFARSTQDDIHPSVLDLTALVRELTQELDAQHPERKTEWVVQEGMRVRADLSLLRVALWNILDNAGKYSQRNAAPRVEVGTTPTADGTTTVHIRDNGVGFSPSEEARLFEPFQRLSSAHGIEGTGLGLPTAARILARHGGRIEAEGEPGRGATFRLVLPDE